MNLKLLQLIKIASVISIPLTLADAPAQEFEPQLGETYFQNDQVICYRLDLGQPEIASFEFSPNIRLSHPNEVWQHESGSSLELQDQFEFQRTENALRDFERSAKDFKFPLAFELTNSDFLLARWEQDFPGFESTELLPFQESDGAERPSGEHFELMLTSGGCELHCYKIAPSRRCRLRLPSAQRAEIISMTVQPYLPGDTNLVLVANQSRILPLFVILSTSGTVRTAMSADAADLISTSNLKNSSENASGGYLAFVSVVD